MVKVHFKTQNKKGQKEASPNYYRTNEKKKRYSGSDSCLSRVRQSKQQPTVDLDTGFYLRTNWSFPMLVLFHQHNLPYVLTSLRSWEIPPGLGRSGCKSGWLLLCSCLQLSVCSLTSQGSWASPSICFCWSPPFPTSSFSWDVWTFTHTQAHNFLLPINRPPPPAFTGGVFCLPQWLFI